WRIALLSPPTGNGNLGDEATVAAVIQNVRRRLPETSIYALSANPRDTERRHQVPAFPAAPVARERAAAGPPILTGVGATEGSRKPRWQRLRRGLDAIPGVHAARAAIRRVLGAFIKLGAEIRFLVGAARLMRGTDLLLLTGSGVLSDHFGGAMNFP